MTALWTLKPCSASKLFVSGLQHLNVMLSQGKAAIPHYLTTGLAADALPDQCDLTAFADASIIGGGTPAGRHRC